MIDNYCLFINQNVGLSFYIAIYYVLVYSFKEPSEDKPSLLIFNFVLSWKYLHKSSSHFYWLLAFLNFNFRLRNQCGNNSIRRKRNYHFWVKITPSVSKATSLSTFAPFEIKNGYQKSHRLKFDKMYQLHVTKDASQIQNFSQVEERNDFGIEFFTSALCAFF